MIPAGGNADGAYPAIVKMNGVLAWGFGDLPHIQLKRNQLFAPQLIKYLLSFCFHRRGIVSHKLRSLYRASAQHNWVIPDARFLSEGV
jgi:hypothetical protein